MAAHSTYDEISLLLHLAKGDEQAFRHIFDHHRDVVYAKALHFMKSPVLAEDILQEVFMKIWKHRNRLAPVENFKAYLHTITRNQIYSHFRKMAGDTLLLEKLGAQSAQDDDPDIIQAIGAKELQEALHAALDLLTKQQRKVFELSRVQGLTHAEIAAALNMQRETVKKHITDSLRTIRDNLHRFPALVQTGILLYIYSA